jgi:hypothetical protein
MFPGEAAMPRYEVTVKTLVSGEYTWRRAPHADYHDAVAEGLAFAVATGGRLMRVEFRPGAAGEPAVAGSAAA